MIHDISLILIIAVCNMATGCVFAAATWWLTTERYRPRFPRRPR